MHTGINIAGLVMGMAYFVILRLFVRDEWRDDRDHEHRDRIYCAASSWHQPFTLMVEHNAEGPDPRGFACVALALAIACVELALPEVNTLAGKPLSYSTDRTRHCSVAF